MTIYIISAISILGYGIVFFLKISKIMKKKVYLSLVLLHLSLLMGFRASSVGTDYYSYIMLIKSLKDNMWYTDLVHSAPVYNIYSSYLYHLFDGNLLYISIITAFIINGAVLIFIYHYSDYVVLPCYCYLTSYQYFKSYNITRQSIAIAFTLISAVFWKRNKKIMSTVSFIIAVGFHNTALISIILFFLLNIKWTYLKLKKTAMICMISFCSFAILFRPAITIFCSIFPRYAVYLGESRHSVYDKGQGRILWIHLFYLLLILIGFYIVWKERNYGMECRAYFRNENVYKLMALAFVFICLGLANYKNLAVGRIILYFQPYFLCLVPYIVRLFKNKILVLSSCVLFFGILLWIQLALNQSGVVPYVIWDTI